MLTPLEVVCIIAVYLCMFISLSVLKIKWDNEHLKKENEKLRKELKK